MGWRRKCNPLYHPHPPLLSILSSVPHEPVVGLQRRLLSSPPLSSLLLSSSLQQHQQLWHNDTSKGHHPRPGFSELSNEGAIRIFVTIITRRGDVLEGFCSPKGGRDHPLPPTHQATGRGRTKKLGFALYCQHWIISFYFKKVKMYQI